MKDTNAGLRDIQPSDTATDITDTATTHTPSRGVFIGTAQSLDFFMLATRTWVTFQGCVAGSVLPIVAIGARKTAGAAAPTTKDVVFLN